MTFFLHELKLATCAALVGDDGRGGWEAQLWRWAGEVAQPIAVHVEIFERNMNLRASTSEENNELKETIVTTVMIC